MIVCSPPLIRFASSRLARKVAVLYLFRCLVNNRLEAHNVRRRDTIEIRVDDSARFHPGNDRFRRRWSPDRLAVAHVSYGG